MKNLIIKFNVLILISLFIFNVSVCSEESEKEVSVIPYEYIKYNNKYIFIKKDKANLSGPDMERLYFEDWNYPYGAVLPPEVIDRMWNQIKNVPSESEINPGNDAVNNWKLIGPFGSNVTTSSAVFSGRVLDIEVGNSANPIIASASGGLWSYFFSLPYTFSDNIPSTVSGSFATQPSNASTIIYGTGEPSVKAGTGLYRSSNSGSSWTKINLGVNPSGFYKIRYQNSNITTVHAASTSGYFRSTNNGLNWTNHLSGNICDVAINSNNNNIIYAGKQNDGLYKSTNNGVNWAKVTTPGMPTTDMGRMSIALGTSNINKVYVSIVNNSDSEMKGIYVSFNEGASWSDVSPPENIFSDQGWYNNIISCDPTNSVVVLAGGVRLWRSSNSGGVWTEIDDDHVHADQHCMEWTSDGNTLYLGNDGGVAVSTNQGVSFSTSINYLPITQYVNFDVGVSNRGVIYGGSQDNGFTGTTNGGASWIFSKGGDGGGIAVDPHSALYVYGTAGVYSGAHKFRRYKSTDKGITWDTNNTGVDPSSTWYTKMRSDRTHPIKLYTNAGAFVYISSDAGEEWSKLNAIPFPVDVSNVNVSKNVSPDGAVVYVALNSTTSGMRLRVYDEGTFYERTSGISSNRRVRGVSTHITNNNTAYAVISGFSGNDKVFKTTNRGLNWSNISSNLPDVPMGDLVPHPSNNNYLYLGSQTGFFRTTNAGANWHRWNNGMPDACIITETKWIDSTLDNGKFYIIAGTYGNSFWTRDISGDDPDHILSLTMHIEGFYNPNSNNTIRDTVRVYLRNEDSPYTIADSSKVFLTSSGTGALEFPLASVNENYYINIKHRNSIETWSKLTVKFDNYSLSYDFTNSASKAFGDNLKQTDASPLEYGIYGGDINQDDGVDAADLLLVYNASNIFAAGYIVSDVTGDNISDATDILLVYNNSNNFVSVIEP